MEFPKSGLKDYLKTGSRVDLFSLRKSNVLKESGWQYLKVNVAIETTTETALKIGNYSMAVVGNKPEAAAVPSTGAGKPEVSGRRNGVLVNLKPTQKIGDNTIEDDAPRINVGQFTDADVAATKDGSTSPTDAPAYDVSVLGTGIGGGMKACPACTTLNDPGNAFCEACFTDF